MQSGKEVAIKLSPLARELEGEADTYQALAGGVGIPQVHWHGYECDFYVLVLDLLGPSLEDLFNYCNRKFSLKTILLIADQLISRLEYIHAKFLKKGYPIAEFRERFSRSDNRTLSA